MNATLATYGTSSGMLVRRNFLSVPARGTPTRAFSAATVRQPLSSFAPLAPSRSRSPSFVPQATQGDEPEVVYNKEFGYSRKDVMIIGAGIFAAGYAMYYGLQATGMEAGYAGNWVQLIMILGLCLGWVSTYIFRVATKQMTYVKQLEQYEEAVMRKRLEEMTPAELEEMVREADAERERKAAQSKAKSENAVENSA